MGLLSRWDARNQKAFEREIEAHSDEAFLEDLRQARVRIPAGSPWQRFRGWLRRENARTRSHVRSPNEHCPACGRPVVAEPLTQNPRQSGPMFTPRTRAELEAACPVHGRPPFNTATRRFEMQQDFPQEK